MIPIFANELNEVLFYTVFFVFYGADFVMTYGIPLTRGRREVRKRERKSFFIFFATMYFTVTFSFFFGYFSYYSGIGELPLLFLYVGTSLIIVGESFRLWAIFTLNKYFSPVVTVYSDHRVVTRGPYGYVRHPAYGGGAISLLGIALSTRSLFSLVLLLPAILVFNYRANIEERLLIESLGEEYVKYKSKVRKKFIPFLY
ncbi:methyltransferase family protein [Stygiolobus caldivivus]|uniref:Isoprenylcysteine carboxyl methyltransferase n=1 Tax=Stygiolobus caldivivus TaxID=2824673 RepID=A0A8D5U5U6_9CREN|nr:isoprenylcysteine carboxylmethyltransferase family protein [Stygiolobus caldivivus]BCU70120.1 isoprenylcysteine carboxyl methyltransferase [Stygiolobus caldivivus]